MSDFLDAALGYAERGRAVLPCMPRGKQPLSVHGLHDATLDADQIRSWWQRCPDANIGIRTGITFDVLDVDGPEGECALSSLLDDAAPPVDGPTVTTGKGWHIWLAVTGLGNRAGIVDHVDWRGNGGYVIAPPSIHPTGAVYRWELPDDPTFGPDAPIQAAPAWLLRLLTPAPALSVPVGVLGRSTQGDGYGQKALEGELGRLAVSPEGQRNDDLHRAAVRLGQLIAARKLEATEVVDQLLTVGRRIGLDDRELEGTITSGLSFGMHNPRRPK